MSTSFTASPLGEHFRDLEQQTESATFGMWIFLATEIMFFGGLFLWYTVERYLHPQGFAEASHHMAVAFGTINTAVLIISSLTMALAVVSAQAGLRVPTVLLLLGTMALGCVFLVIKGLEYADHISHHLLPGPTFAYPGPNAEAAEMFFSQYFVITGLHALHLLIGICVVGVIALRQLFSRHAAVYSAPVEATGLYWHFVDAVWIFLYPLFYLIDLHR